jgi:hypothetical protein
MKETIGQRVVAAVISHQLGISTERAMKLYVRKHKIHPSWEAVGEELLRNSHSFASGSSVRSDAREDGASRAQADPS